MTRLVALQHRDPETMLHALDQVWDDGDAALPLDPRAPDRHTAALLDRLAPDELRTDAGRQRRIHGHPVPEGTALVVTTSGSTGPPQGIVLSHAALEASTVRSVARLGAMDGVPWLGVLPLHHIAGISVALRSRAAGRQPLLHDRDTPELVTAAEPAWISLVPLQLQRLLEAEAELAHHHGVLLGGAAAPAALLDRATAAGVHVVTSYGATETSGGCVYDGVPLAGVQVRIADSGRIQVRTPTLATGVRLPDGGLAPIADDAGWWTTSDRGTVDDEGRLAVHGRADDVVVSGGENVPLTAVQAALADIDGIRAVAVVGLPDEHWGTAVTAVVVPTGAPPTLGELRAALAGVLPRPHLPTALVTTDQLPTTSLGKVTTGSVEAALAAGGADLVRWASA